jgi:hypothetical protein
MFVANIFVAPKAGYCLNLTSYLRFGVLEFATMYKYCLICAWLPTPYPVGNPPCRFEPLRHPDLALGFENALTMSLRKLSKLGFDREARAPKDKDKGTT